MLYIRVMMIHNQKKVYFFEKKGLPTDNQQQWNAACNKTKHGSIQDEVKSSISYFFSGRSSK